MVRPLHLWGVLPLGALPARRAVLRSLPLLEEVLIHILL